MEGEQPSTPDGPEESAPTEPVAPPPPPPSPAAHQEPRRRGGPNLLVIGIIVVLIVGVLSGGGVFANSYLSNTYSPKRAVTDYFAAMAKGDVIGMMNNATFQSGDSTYAGFFGQEALTGMVALDQNKQVSNLDILSTTSVDSSTSNVKLTVSWGGTQRSLTYTVVKDTSRVHYFFYDSWRVQVPYATINVTVPVQAGVIQVDGIAAPPAKVEAIQGFHNVTMAATPFYDSSAKLVDTVDTSAPASVKFDGALSASAKAAAVAAVKANFGDAAEWMKTSTCSPDLKTNIDCPYDTYTLPANCNCYWTLEMPGGNIDAYHGWIFNFTGDPTTNMTLTITSTTNKLTASGTCTMSLVVDGSATYNFKGTWTGTLMWGGGGFSSDVTENCDAARA
ncbi:MAG TPA: hypothetical protein VHO95_10555 [Candidatus Dormibacteraeota bacterium]|nr:hypothetical protein [Candidatus Dormibacteraeota bacterium]